MPAAKRYKKAAGIFCEFCCSIRVPGIYRKSKKYVEILPVVPKVRPR